MVNKINELTKIFLTDYYYNFNKLNKKSKYTWLLGVFIVAIAYLSYKIMNFLSKTEQPEIFFKIYLPIFATIMMLQLIILISSIFYYSDDIKNILPLPIKPIEILIAKFNTTVIIMYFLEALFLLIPFLMYGMLIAKNITIFILMIIVFFIFPILYTLLINIILFFMMKLSKIIKNKNVLQLVISISLTFIISYLLMSSIQKIMNQELDMEQVQAINIKIEEINKNYIITNPIIKILTSNNFYEILINLLKIILINILAFIIFIFIGTKMYLKNILISNNYIKLKNIEKIKYKKNKKKIAYLKIELKKLIKNPTFFMQNIFQYICIIIVAVILLNIFVPIFVEQVKTENLIEDIGIEQFKLQAILMIIGIIQIIFTFSNLSLTAISREGKNAGYMKYIPIKLSTQLKLKAMPQIIINTFFIFTILTTIYLNIKENIIIYYIIAFITAMILNIINSYILVLIDINKPNLKWSNEESVAKNNQNKLSQYVLSIITILVLSYFSKIFNNMNFLPAIIIINLVFISIFIVLNIYINKNDQKIFKKIY